MASSVDLVVRVLADTSQAGRAFEGLSGNIGKALGIGAGAAAAGTIVKASADAATAQQAAMAQIVASYNSADFRPGTASYVGATNEIIQQSQTLATSFDDVAAVHNQAARFVDDFGKKLPADEVASYTDTVLKLSKISLDNLAPTDIESRLATIAKLSNQSNFTELGNAVAASSSVHSQGEGPMLDSAIAILQSGGALGVSQAQALGLGNFLTDLGSGGQRGGTSIGRLLLRQNTAADEELNPAVAAGKARTARDAQEHLDDLQTSLKEAEASQAQMFGQHGLKTQFKKNPEAMMASEDRIAKLNREIADSKADIATAASVEAQTRKGQLNITAMAKTAGMSPTDFATLAKSDPIGALTAFTTGLHGLDKTQRGAAETAAGINLSKDVQTINLLQSRPDVLSKQIETAQGQLDNPTQLNQMAQVVLDTTQAKNEDVANMRTNVLAAGGEGPRQGLDALDDTILKLGTDAQNSSGPMGQLVGGLDGLGGVLGTLGPFIGPLIAAKMMGGGAATAATTAGTGAASTVAEAAGVGGLLAGGAGAAAAGGLGFLQIEDMKNSLDALNNARSAVGLPTINIDMGGVIAQGGSPDEMFNHMTAQLKVAWDTAMSTTPVSGPLGGNIGGQAPH